MMDQSYNDASTKTLARTFGVFYLEMRNMGIPAEVSLELTKEYIKSISSGAKEINDKKAQQDEEGQA